VSARRKSQPSREHATSYDVAERAGVSQSAVSRVFQEGASASQAMRKRVMAAAGELGYRPNAIARGLITRRSNMVAVLISQLTNLYYPELLVQLAQQFSDRGVRVLLFALAHEADVESVLEQMLQYQVDGILTAAMLSPKQLRPVAKARIPIVFYNRTFMDRPVNSVRCDQGEGVRWLVDELARSGHRSFGVIEGPPDSFVGVERRTATLNELGRLGITDVTCAGGDYGYEAGRRAFAEIMARRGSPPDAVIGANDVMAIGCIDEARGRYGLRVPEDLSVAGFDGVGPARYASYGLTTIRQPVERMAEAAMSLLLEHIENPGLPPEQRVFSGIRIRGASARLAESES
jgi:DNA-binding LacI/PurR family transcriptional regulator